MDRTAGLFKELCGCLKSQEAIVDRLTDLAQSQFAALRENSLEDLQKTVNGQESCAAEMEAAEQRRLFILGSLEKALDLEKGVTLSKLLPFARGPERSCLQQLFGALQEKLKNLQELNSVNAGLIKRSRLVNGRIIRIMSSGTATTYGLKGEVRSDLKQAASLDRSV